MIRYIITAIKANGQREVAFTRGDTFESREEAMTYILELFKNNSLERLEELVGKKVEIRRVECRPGGESKQIYFDEETTTNTGNSDPV